MRKKSPVWITLPPILLLLAASAAARSGDEYVRPADVKMGSLLVRSDVHSGLVPATTVETKVRIRVTGMIGRARIEQVFRNPSDAWVEGVYAFPLPERSAVDTLRMVIGERIIEGQIQEKEKARKIYQTAKQQGKKASLLEQERPNIFTMSVAHIGPGEEIRIELEYQEDIRYEAGRFDLRFPMVVAPRYIPGQPGTEHAAFSGTGWAKPTAVVPDADRITPPVLDPRAARASLVDLEIELNVGMPLVSVDSHSHRARVEHEAGFRYVVRPGEGAVPADRDFTLTWAPDVGTAPKAALFTESLDGDNYVLLMLLPPDKESTGTRLPRETIFVIDTSGSMHGSSIEQARRALLVALGRLQPDDTFNVIQFNKVTSKLFEQPVAADAESVEEAHEYVERLGASGGTEMMSALTAAFEQRRPGRTDRVRQIVFITDGSVGNEAQLFSHIRDHLGERRLFTVGIGSAPNAYFMTKAAELGLGTFTYVGAVSEVSEKIGGLFAKLESPVLSHIELDFEDDRVEVWPKRVPDLYIGEPIVVTARIPDVPSGLDVRGRFRGEPSARAQRERSESRGGGAPAAVEYEPWGIGFQLRGGMKHSGVSKLWARRQIASLMDSIVEGADREDVRAKVVDVALRHHLVSRFTSLVAVDVTPTAPHGAPVTKPLPTALPAGWSEAHVTGSLPQGSTPAQLLAMLGFLVLIVGLLIHWSGDRSCKEKRSVFPSWR